MRLKPLLAAAALLFASAFASAAHAAYAFGLSDFNPGNALLITTTRGNYAVTNTDSGTWKLQSNLSVLHDATVKNYLAGQCCNGDHHSYFTFNLARYDILGDLISASLRVFTYTVGGTAPLSLWDISSPLDDVRRSSTMTEDDFQIFGDLGTGLNYATVELNDSDSNRFIEIALNDVALGQLELARQGEIGIGASVAGSNAIPEPGTWALVALALMALLFIVRHRDH